MYKKEYPPLFKEGFMKIKIWQLDETFLHPFGENEHRKYLIDRIQAFVNEFLAIGLEAEMWIDGSFGTEKPDPEDVDVLFLIDPTEVDNLDARKGNLFQRLLLNREETRARYSLDVYFIDKNDISEQKKWIEDYGFDSKKLNSKGIFKLDLKNNV